MTVLEKNIDIDEIIKIKKFIKERNQDILIEKNIELLETFLIKYGYLLDKKEMTDLMRKMKKNNVPNRYI
jgi:hypothetical protein